MPTGVRRTAIATLVTSVVALVATSIALAGNAGFGPPPAHSPNAHRIVQSYIFVSIFTGAIFVIVVWSAAAAFGALAMPGSL